MEPNLLPDKIFTLIPEQFKLLISRSPRINFNCILENSTHKKKASAMADAFSEIEYNLRLEVFRNSNTCCFTKVEIKLAYIWTVVIIV